MDLRAYKVPTLVRVSPSALVMTGHCDEHDPWDNSVVQNDLNVYVQRSRTLNGTPVIDIESGACYVRRGVPFVRAALDASPPLSSIVCSTKSTLAEIQQAGLHVLSPTTLLNEQHSRMPYEKVEIVFFASPVDVETQHKVVDRLDYACRCAIRVAISRYEWITGNTALLWTWWCEVERENLGRDLVKTIEDIATVVKVRSWNGILFEALCLGPARTNEEPGTS